MADILRNNIKKVLIASDIFGFSDAFYNFLAETNTAEHAIIVSPFNKVKTHFATEKQAYQCFQQHGGIDAYVLRLTEILETDNNIKHLVGFSAGAAALYRVMSNLPHKNIKLTLFYPGQIRFFLDKHPIGRCHIIFPKAEPNFALAKVIQVLEQQANIKVEHSIYQHGFMNKASKGFNKTAYVHYCHMLQTLVFQNE